MLGRQACTTTADSLGSCFVPVSFPFPPSSLSLSLPEVARGGRDEVFTENGEQVIEHGGARPMAQCLGRTGDGLELEAALVYTESSRLAQERPWLKREKHVRESYI